jgi:mono/diheme cytochrome c family protein
VNVRSILLSVIFLSVVAIPTFAQDDTAEIDHAESKTLENPFPFAENTVRAGHKIYARNCITCHGMDGKGDTDVTKALPIKPNDFTLGKFKFGNSDGEIFSVIKHATKSGMVPYAEKLKEPQIWHLVNYVRSLGPMDDGKPKVVIEDEILENPIESDYASQGRGQQFYVRFCITCHGKDGKGDTEMREFLDTAPSDLTDDTWLYGDRDGDIFKIIKEGTENEMEAFEDRLADDRIWHIVNYVRTLAKK